MKRTLHKRYNYNNKLNVPSIDLKGKRGKGGEGARTKVHRGNMFWETFVSSQCFVLVLGVIKVYFRGPN